MKAFRRWPLSCTQSDVPTTIIPESAAVAGGIPGVIHDPDRPFERTSDAYEQASRFFEQGKNEEAELLCREAVAVGPRHAEAWHLLGILSYQQRRYPAAVRLFRRACALNNSNAHYHSNLGGALQADGKLTEAAVRYRRAVFLKPLFAEAHYNLGNVLRTQGKQSASIEAFARAIVCRPDLHEAHTNLGNVLQSIGEWAAADNCYSKALELKPHSAEIHSNLGNLRRAEGRLDEAIEQYELALRYDPDFADACTNLGTVFHHQGKLQAALACHQKAVACRPDFAEARHNLACVLQTMGSLSEAIANYDQAIDLKPEYASAHFGKALICLLQGDFSTGWPGYEWRWRSGEHTTRWHVSEHPVWCGERLSQGRLFLWGEQGVGDEVLFAGMVNDAVATGSACVLACEPRLVPLFTRSFPRVEVVPAHSAEPAGIAAHLPTGSLPRLFRQGAADFTKTRSPYLLADPIGQECFRQKYDDGRRIIGLAWRSTNLKSGVRRSIDLSQLALLFTRTDVRWVSLQYGDHGDLEHETDAVGAPMLIDRSVAQFENLDTFAAQVSAMDLVVTIDNSTAHLAGALGVPVWTMLPFAANWVWLDAGEKSAWYPSMRLFRQPRLGDWQSVIKGIDQQLDTIARSHAHRDVPLLPEADAHSTLTSDSRRVMPAVYPMSPA